MDFANPEVLARFLARPVVPIEEQLRGIVKPPPPVVVLERHTKAVAYAVRDSLGWLLNERPSRPGGYRGHQWEYPVWPDMSLLMDQMMRPAVPTFDLETVMTQRSSSAWWHHTRHRPLVSLTLGVDGRWRGAPRESIVIGVDLYEETAREARFNEGFRATLVQKLTTEAMAIIGEKWWPKTPRIRW